MCLFRSRSAKALPIPPNPVQPRVDNQQASKKESLPDEKDLLDPNEIADVSYGQKKPETKAGTRTGAGALTIGLNQGGSTNSGMNV